MNSIRSTAKSIVRAAIAAVFGIAALASCIDDVAAPTPAPARGGIAFEAKLPAPTMVNTRGVGSVDENKIDNIYVLAFEQEADGELLHKEKITSFTFSGTNNDIAKFNSTIPKGDYDVVLVANAAAVIEAMSGTVTKSTLANAVVLSSMLDATGANWKRTSGAVEHIVMVSPESPVSASATVASFSLNRIAARIDVINKVATATFTMTSVRYYNYTNKAYLVPRHTAHTDYTTPSTPSGARQSGNCLTFDNPLDFAGQKFEQKLYPLEAEGGWEPLGALWKDNNPCLVIGGKYNNGSETFYRIDFITKRSADDRIFHSILGNHHYIVTVNAITGNGYPDAETARKSAPVNYDATTEVVVPGGGYITVDGYYHLSISERALEMAIFGETKSLVLKTNYEGWSARVYSDAACTNDITSTGWLTVTPLSETAATIDGTSVGITATANWGPLRTAYIRFTAGRLSAVAEVTQKQAYILAPPGVLGVGVDSKKLTLKGSKEYPDGTAGETVYVTYFKWGSTVALGQGMGENDLFDLSDVAWKPTGFAGTISNWASVPCAALVGDPYDPAPPFPAQNNAAGLGDPCRLAENGGGDYRMPIGNPYEQFTDGGWVNEYSSSVKVPGSWSDYGSTKSQFYPAAGVRVSGPTAGKLIFNNDTEYWSRTPISGAQSGTLYISSLLRSVLGNRPFDFALPIRCVKDTRIIAPPGVIGVGAESGNLTIKGSKEYPDGTAGETVYVTYFKWGSTVAIGQGTGENDGFDLSDVAWKPTGFAGTITNWASVPYGTGATFPAQNNAAGLGDPCRLAENGGGSYRMPTGDPYEQFTDGGWVANYSASVKVPGRWSDYGSTKSQFYPAAGARNVSGILTLSSTYGYYWSDTAWDVNNASVLYFDNTTVTNNAMATRPTFGNPVRCVEYVPAVPTLTVTGAATTGAYDYSGGTKIYSVTSYVTEGGTDSPVAWTAEFSTDGTTWSATKPTWLTAFTASAAGSKTAANYDATTEAFTGVTTNTEDNLLKAKAVVATSAAPHDLSTRGGLTTQNTANCYVINAPGYYKLPLVYGNARKNGANNTSAYSTGAGTNKLTAFVRHDNVAITNPYLYNNSGVVPHNATLVWMDAPGLITNVRLVDSNQSLAFDVPATGIEQGNAIVAVRNSDSVILWSWHIWVAPSEIFDAANPQTDATVNRTAPNTTFNFMKYNLGWCTAKTVDYGTAPRSIQVRISQTGIENPLTRTFTVTQNNGTVTTGGNNPYWQFGRKDPMRPAVGTMGTADKTLYYGTGGYTYVTEPFGTTTIGTAIANPNTFYTVNNGDWCSTRYDNLWSMANTVVDLNTTKPVKTVYDPSPVGFIMPPSGAWTGFTSDGTNVVSGVPANCNVSGSWNKGWNFHLSLNGAGGTTFYPAMGYRNYRNEFLSGVGSYGYYWAATPISNVGFTRALTFYNTAINPQNQFHRSAGCAVRSVKE